jgi:hypothetical protein
MWASAVCPVLDHQMGAEPKLVVLSVSSVLLHYSWRGCEINLLIRTVYTGTQCEILFGIAHEDSTIILWLRKLSGRRGLANNEIKIAFLAFIAADIIELDSATYIFAMY